MEKRKIDWASASFLIGYQFVVLLCLPFYFLHNRPSGALIAISVGLLVTLGTSLSAGYHRYFSHKTYKAHPIIESFLLFFSPLLMQSSAVRWSHDHRLHHAFVDTDKDPYSIKKGFWYAHFTWMLYKQDPVDPKLVTDLLKNPRIRFQHRYIAPLMFGSNIAVGLIVGYILNDYVGAFMLAVGLRLLLSHHMTWFINSLAHTWGDKPFCQEQTAVNNVICALLTFGEGYHNYHHVYAKDYRNGVRWFHFDPTKWVLWLLSQVGLVKDLRRMDPLQVRKMLVIKRKSLLMEKICLLSKDKQELFMKEVEQMSERMLTTLSKIKESPQLWTTFKSDWKQWRSLSRTILKYKVKPSRA